MTKIDKIPTPFYIVYEDKIRANLDLITDVARRSGAKIIMAFKANALWKTFPILREYGIGCTASSLNELRLGKEYLTDDIHSYCPAYTDSTIGEYIKNSTHITFNSLSQLQRFLPLVKQHNVASEQKISAGLRVNPQCSVITTDLYNPALPGSRFGARAEELADGLPDGVDGLHFHALCESTSYDLAKVLDAFESQYAHLLPSLKWVNMGGGHIMTRKDYDTDHLVELLKGFKQRHPNIEIILEPGSAFMWRTGDLITSVVDIIENDGIATAITDVSFACHMPDTLEMPYQPAVTEAVASCEKEGLYNYCLGGNSCLSGDYAGMWAFQNPLTPGTRLTLEDMNHYTTVKTTMFNGIQHPDIILCKSNGTCEYLRKFTYEDYRDRMC